MSAYGQFCPVSKAAELLDQRWTLLVVRELLMGSSHFNDLRRGVPRMSPTLLSRRLRDLIRAGVVQRVDGRYLLTDAGEELRPVVLAMGEWGIRWIPQLGELDLDPRLLLWDMRRHVDLTALPPGRTVVHFTFAEVTAKERHWWMVLTRDGVDVCDFDPGYDGALTVQTTLRCLVDVWRGEQSWDAAQAGGGLTIVGPRSLRQKLPSWFVPTHFAQVPRPSRAPADPRT